MKCSAIVHVHALRFNSHLGCHVSCPEYEILDVRLTSIGSYRIFGYLARRRASGPQGAVLVLPEYRSVQAVPP